jgi:DNA methylase
LRTGLPLSKTNEACGVANAATRKYFTNCHLWYYPPVEMFEKFVAYANQHGDRSGLPYFSLDEQRPIRGEEWGRMRAKFRLEHGITNVWNTPPVRGSERLKSTGSAALHSNQKPLTLTERIILASSEPGDVVWEPFGGLATTALASILNDRRCYTAEIIEEVYKSAVERLQLEYQRWL